MSAYRSYTTKSYVKAIRAIHGDKYDYSEVVYTRLKKHVTITCPIHGKFTRQACTMLIGKTGCPDCDNTSKTMPKDEYIERASAKFNNRFTYIDLPETVRYNSKVTARCKYHGTFSQRAGAHLHMLEHGCPKCANIARSKAVTEHKMLERMRKQVATASARKVSRPPPIKQPTPNTVKPVDSAVRSSDLTYPSDIDRTKYLSMLTRTGQK